MLPPHARSGNKNTATQGFKLMLCCYFTTNKNEKMNVFAIQKESGEVRLYVYKTRLSAVVKSMFNTSRLRKMNEKLVSLDVIFENENVANQFDAQGSIEVTDSEVLESAFGVSGGVVCPVYC